MPEVPLHAAPLGRVRSLLFVPGDKPAMIAKLARVAPDVAVVDLEDAVAAADKAAARAVACAAVDELAKEWDGTVLVRVNPVGSPWFADDLTAAAGCAAHGLVLPKLGSRAELDRLAGALADVGWSSPVVVAGIETGLGVADARPLLADGPSAAYFGAEDYAADVGARRTRGGDEVRYARSRVFLAARLAGIPAIDQAVVTLGDDEHFRADARAGADLGYQGKICIHPRQVQLCAEVFMPGADEVARARRVVAAAHEGVAVVDGQMVDDVHVRMARTVLARAGEVT